MVYGVLMLFQMDFKGTYHNIRVRLRNALTVCDLYGLFLHSSHFLTYKDETFLCYFGLKNLF